MTIGEKREFFRFLKEKGCFEVHRYNMVSPNINKCQLFNDCKGKPSEYFKVVRKQEVLLESFLWDNTNETPYFWLTIYNDWINSIEYDK